MFTRKFYELAEGNWISTVLKISRNLTLGLTECEIKEIAFDRTYNMDNYIVYPDAEKVLKVLSKEKLGITPILIAANPASDVDSPYLKIHSLSELLEEPV